MRNTEKFAASSYRGCTVLRVRKRGIVAGTARAWTWNMRIDVQQTCIDLQSKGFCQLFKGN